MVRIIKYKYFYVICAGKFAQVREIKFVFNNVIALGPVLQSIFPAKTENIKHTDKTLDAFNTC